MSDHDIRNEIEKLADDLGIDKKRSIGEVAQELGIKTHVIRFWEENFPQINPEIGAGKRRYYRNRQVDVLKKIKKFLYEDGYTIAGLQKLLKKRKSENNAEGDLDIILNEEHKEEIIKDNIEPSDFSEPENEFNKGSQIDPNYPIRDFASIQISAIDADIQKIVLTRLKSLKTNLEKLKSLKVDPAEIVKNLG